MWQLLSLNLTLRQHEWSDLHLDFCVFFSNQHFARKLRSKGLSKEYYDWKKIEPKINKKNMIQE